MGIEKIMKKLTLEEIATLAKPEFASLLFGWMQSAAKKSPKIRREILACANWRDEFGGVKRDNAHYFNLPKT
jgi:hypothetical protein